MSKHLMVFDFNQQNQQQQIAKPMGRKNIIINQKYIIKYKMFSFLSYSSFHLFLRNVMRFMQNYSVCVFIQMIIE